MYHLLQLLQSENDDFILDVDFQMLQDWLVVDPSSNLHTVSTMFFCKDRGSNVAVKNLTSRFSMFFPTRATVKLANGNMWHTQWIGIISCFFTRCSIIYPVGPVYYFPNHSTNTISPVSLNFNIGSQKVASEPLKHCDFVDLHCCAWRSPYQTKNNLNYLQIEIVKFNPQRNRNICVPTIYAISKKNPSQPIHQCFGRVSISSVNLMSIKGLAEGLPTHIPDLE